MFRPAGWRPVPPVTGLTIAEVTTAGGLAEFSRTIAEAFPMPGAEFDPAGLGGPIRFWTGSIDGRPIATAGAVVHAGIVQVEYVSCHADVRGRGIGEAITETAAGCEPSLPAVLLASDMGRPVYRRMGFTPVMRYTMWERPAG
jgi:hypothetical protein